MFPDSKKIIKSGLIQAFIAMLFILVAPVISFSAELIHTIQIGSHLTEDRSLRQYDSVLAFLEEDQKDSLRIEKIGIYYALRVGDFDDYDAAEELLRTVRSAYPGAIMMTAYLNNHKLVKMYRTPAVKYPVPETSLLKNRIAASPEKRISAPPQVAVAEPVAPTPAETTKLPNSDDTVPAMKSIDQDHKAAGTKAAIPAGSVLMRNDSPAVKRPAPESPAAENKTLASSEKKLSAPPQLAAAEPVAAAPAGSAKLSDSAAKSPATKLEEQDTEVADTGAAIPAGSVLMRNDSPAAKRPAPESPAVENKTLASSEKKLSAPPQLAAAEPVAPAPAAAAKQSGGDGSAPVAKPVSQDTIAAGSPKEAQKPITLYLLIALAATFSLLFLVLFRSERKAAKTAQGGTFAAEEASPAELAEEQEESGARETAGPADRRELSDEVKHIARDDMAVPTAESTLEDEIRSLAAGAVSPAIAATTISGLTEAGKDASQKSCPDEGLEVILQAEDVMGTESPAGSKAGEEMSAAVASLSTDSEPIVLAESSAADPADSRKKLGGDIPEEAAELVEELHVAATERGEEFPLKAEAVITDLQETEYTYGAEERTVKKKRENRIGCAVETAIFTAKNKK